MEDNSVTRSGFCPEQFYGIQLPSILCEAWLSWGLCSFCDAGCGIFLIPQEVWPEFWKLLYSYMYPHNYPVSWSYLNASATQRGCQHNRSLWSGPCWLFQAYLLYMLLKFPWAPAMFARLTQASHASNLCGSHFSQECPSYCFLHLLKVCSSFKPQLKASLFLRLPVSPARINHFPFFTSIVLKLWDF